MWFVDNYLGKSNLKDFVIKEYLYETWLNYLNTKKHLLKDDATNKFSFGILKFCLKSLMVILFCSFVSF